MSMKIYYLEFTYGYPKLCIHVWWILRRAYILFLWYILYIIFIEISQLLILHTSLFTLWWFYDIGKNNQLSMYQEHGITVYSCDNKVVSDPCIVFDTTYYNVALCITHPVPGPTNQPRIHAIINSALCFPLNFVPYKQGC